MSDRRHLIVSGPSPLFIKCWGEFRTVKPGDTAVLCEECHVIDASSYIVGIRAEQRETTLQLQSELTSSRVRANRLVEEAIPFLGQPAVVTGG